MDDGSVNRSDRQEPLAYVTNQTYAARSQGTPGQLLLALLGGVAAAVLVGVATFLVVLTRFKVGFLVALVGQGVAVGLALAGLLHLLKIRGKAIGWVLGIVCGLVSFGAFHYAAYIHNAITVRDNFRTRQLAGGADQQVVDHLAAHPLDLFDALVIFPQTRHHGFAGYLMLRIPKLVALTFLQIALTVCIAGGLGKSVSARPFCEDCGSWFKPPINVAVLPASLSDPLVHAIRSGDPGEVLPLHNVKGDLVGGTAIARMHACPRCGERFVDVVIKTFGAYAIQRNVMPLHRVSAEMVEALRYEPDEAADDAETSNDGGHAE